MKRCQARRQAKEKSVEPFPLPKPARTSGYELLPSVWAHAAAPLPMINPANEAAAMACLSCTVLGSPPLEVGLDRSVTGEPWIDL